MGWACTKLWVWVNYDFIVLFKILRFRMSNIARNDIMKWRFQILYASEWSIIFLRRCSVHIKRVAPIMSAGGWVLVYVPFNRLLVEFWVAKTMTFFEDARYKSGEYFTMCTYRRRRIILPRIDGSDRSLMTAQEKLMQCPTQNQQAAFTSSSSVLSLAKFKI